MEKQITDILRNLMACASVTNTEKEIAAETWMLVPHTGRPVAPEYRMGAGKV